MTGVNTNGGNNPFKNGNLTGVNTNGGNNPFALSGNRNKSNSSYLNALLPNENKNAIMLNNGTLRAFENIISRQIASKKQKKNEKRKKIKISMKKQKVHKKKR